MIFTPKLNKHPLSYRHMDFFKYLLCLKGGRELGTSAQMGRVVYAKTEALFPGSESHIMRVDVIERRAWYISLVNFPILFTPGNIKNSHFKRPAISILLSLFICHFSLFLLHSIFIIIIFVSLRRVRIHPLCRVLL